MSSSGRLGIWGGVPMPEDDFRKDLEAAVRDDVVWHMRNGELRPFVPALALAEAQDERDRYRAALERIAFPQDYIASRSRLSGIARAALPDEVLATRSREGSST